MAVMKLLIDFEYDGSEYTFDVVFVVAVCHVFAQMDSAKRIDLVKSSDTTLELYALFHLVFAHQCEMDDVPFALFIQALKHYDSTCFGANRRCDADTAVVSALNGHNSAVFAYFTSPELFEHTLLGVFC